MIRKDYDNISDYSQNPFSPILIIEKKFSVNQVLPSMNLFWNIVSRQHLVSIFLSSLGMTAVQQHRQSHKRSTELTVSCLGLSKKQVFLFKFGSFGLVTGARIEAPEVTQVYPRLTKVLRTSMSLYAVP